MEKTAVELQNFYADLQKAVWLYTSENALEPDTARINLLKLTVLIHTEKAVEHDCSCPQPLFDFVIKLFRRKSFISRNPLHGSRG